MAYHTEGILSGSVSRRIRRNVGSNRVGDSNLQARDSHINQIFPAARTAWSLQVAARPLQIAPGGNCAGSRVNGVRSLMIDQESQGPAVLAPARYVLLPLANLITGYSVKAMQRKIERGDWQEGKVWRRAPDGRILIDITGYQKWVEDR
jgi:hypothetical protein